MKKSVLRSRAQDCASYFMKSSALISAYFLFLAVPAEAWTFLEALGLKEPSDYVEISVTHDSTCPEDFPLNVRITNNSNESIESTAFRVSGRRDGYSSEIYGHRSGDGIYYSDRIIEPTVTYSSCWRIPNDGRPLQRLDLGRYSPEEMIWTGEIIHATFVD